MLREKKILLGVSGSIAAYKAILLVRQMVKAGAEVKVVLTPSAKDFVSSLTLATISNNPVLVDLFDGDAWANHVVLGRWAHVMVIAPLSCNSLAKMSHGICDNLLLATYLSATCPVIVAPAMDEDMWQHPATKANLQKLESFGNKIIPVEKGELASGLYGEGRMAEPEAIFQHIQDIFFLKKDLSGKKALVTAGPTQEPIDPVRYIGNHSTGKMGVAIAREMAGRGAEVELVIGPSSIEVNIPGVKVQQVQSAEEMYNACQEIFSRTDIAVMSAAVADYRPATPSKEKIKKKTDTLILELTRNKDILQTLGQQKRTGQILVGFALENEYEKEYAIGKLESKNADLMILNSLKDEGAGFGYDTNKITIFEKDGKQLGYERKSKQQVAKDIVDRIVNMIYA
jgi:phosphopantothenoylcysteine decarboxylase / phosphopantothenate---cysteine ligase